MNPEKSITVEEVKQFFSSTAEFKVTEAGVNIKISYTSDKKTTSLLMWTGALTIQQLIRQITQLVWNHCHNVMD